MAHHAAAADRCPGLSCYQSSALLGGAIHVTKGGFVRLGCSSVSQCTAQE